MGTGVQLKIQKLNKAHSGAFIWKARNEIDIFTPRENVYSQVEQRSREIRRSIESLKEEG